MISFSLFPAFCNLLISYSPRVSANVIIEETFFLEAKLKRYGVLGMLKPTFKNPCIAKYAVLVENKRLSIAKLQDHQR